MRLEAAWVIHRWAKLGDGDRALSILRATCSQGIKADTVSFNAVIDAFAANGDVGKALSLLDEMSCNGRNTVPTPVTFNSVLKACARSGDVARADAVLEDMQNRQCSPDLISYNSAMCACAKALDTGRAQELRRDMQHRDLLPDLVSFNTILNACARGGDVAEALQVLPQLEAARLSPDLFSYSSILNCYAQGANATAARATLSEMRERTESVSAKVFLAGLLPRYQTLQPNVVCFNSALNAHSRAGDPAGVEGLLQEMHIERAAGGEFLRQPWVQVYLEDQWT
eukprot:s246_g3.t1